MLVEVHEREVRHTGVEQLDGAIAASHHKLVLVGLRPGDVVLRVVGVKPVLYCQL